MLLYYRITSLILQDYEHITARKVSDLPAKMVWLRCIRKRSAPMSHGRRLIRSDDM